MGGRNPGFEHMGTGPGMFINTLDLHTIGPCFGQLKNMYLGVSHLRCGNFEVAFTPCKRKIEGVTDILPEGFMFSNF